MDVKTGPLPGIDLEHYVRLLIRQKWFVLMPALVGMIGMGIYSLTLTNQYRATSTVLVEPQALPKRYLESTVSYGPETYVRTLVEQVKSVSRLEKVINEFNLYEDMKRRGKTLEEIVAYMRDHIEIVRRGSDTFSITFKGEDPEKVREVTNRLADLFIEENIKFRLLKSENNVKLLEDQAKKLRAQVMEQERTIERFKAANLDRLPDQQQTVQIQLSAAQRQLEAITQSLMEKRIRANRLRETLSRYKPVVVTSKPTTVSEDRKALEKARKELDNLLIQYSERHPDVKRKKAEVAALERRVAEAEAGQPSTPTRRVVYSAKYKATDEELKLVEEDITRLEAEEERVKQRIDELNERLEAMPLVALKLSELTNGLSVKQDQADAYQKKATDAMASLAMERNNQGSQFRSLDRARTPSKPVSPNRPVLIVIGALIGLVLGIIIMVGLDILFRPFLDEQDLARFAGVQVLVSIPQVGPFPSEWERFRGQLSNLTRFMLGSLSLGDETYATGMVPPEGQGTDAPLPPSSRSRRWVSRRYVPASKTLRPPPWDGGRSTWRHDEDREPVERETPAGARSHQGGSPAAIRRPPPRSRQGNGRIEYASGPGRRQGRSEKGVVSAKPRRDGMQRGADGRDGGYSDLEARVPRRPRGDGETPRIRIMRRSGVRSTPFEVDVGVPGQTERAPDSGDNGVDGGEGGTRGEDFGC